MRHAKFNKILLVYTGSLWLLVSQNCSPLQHEMEQKYTAEIKKSRQLVWPAHAYNSSQKNSLINSQRNGIANFGNIDPKLV